MQPDSLGPFPYSSPGTVPSPTFVLAHSTWELARALRMLAATQEERKPMGKVTIGRAEYDNVDRQTEQLRREFKGRREQEL